MILEIAANNFASALAAYQGGAHRVELCDNMSEGGTSPSIGTLRQCINDIVIPCYPIIRPRGGDFCYSLAEIKIMQYDIESFKDAGAVGIVIGCLTKNGCIDMPVNKKLIACAGDMDISFHRAFDRTIDAAESLKHIIDLGCTRVLTSGQQKNAHLGMHNINKLLQIAQHHISLMPGAGVTPENILEIIAATKCTEIHASAKAIVANDVVTNDNFKNDNYIASTKESVIAFVDKLNM
jgi:copper homeostasis protein